MTYYSNQRVRSRGQTSLRRNRNTVAYERTANRLGPVSNILLVGLLLTMFGLLYLVQITKTSVYGFDVSNLSDNKTQLEQENQALRVEAARLQSLARIEDSELVADFQPQQDLTFLDN